MNDYWCPKSVGKFVMEVGLAITGPGQGDRLDIKQYSSDTEELFSQYSVKCCDVFLTTQLHQKAIQW